MNPLMQELQQRAASQVEVAFEAGYDAAAESAYNAGFEDGKETGFDEAIKLVETTREAFGIDPTYDIGAVTGDARFEGFQAQPLTSDAGDECDCGCQTERLGVALPLTGDYDADLDTLVYGLTLMSETIFDTESALIGTLDLLEASVAASVELARQVGTLQVQVESLQRDADLAEADALFLESLAGRIAALEDLDGILL